MPINSDSTGATIRDAIGSTEFRPHSRSVCRKDEPGSEAIEVGGGLR